MTTETIELVDNPHLILGHDYIMFMPSTFIKPTWRNRHPRLFQFKDLGDIKRMKLAVSGILNSRGPVYGEHFNGRCGKQTGVVTVLKGHEVAIRLIFANRNESLASVGLTREEAEYFRDSLAYMYKEGKKRASKQSRQTSSLLSTTFAG